MVDFPIVVLQQQWSALTAMTDDTLVADVDGDVMRSCPRPAVEDRVPADETIGGDDDAVARHRAGVAGSPTGAIHEVTEVVDMRGIPVTPRHERRTIRPARVVALFRVSA